MYTVYSLNLSSDKIFINLSKIDVNHINCLIFLQMMKMTPIWRYIFILNKGVFPCTVDRSRHWLQLFTLKIADLFPYHNFIKVTQDLTRSADFL